MSTPANRNLLIIIGVLLITNIAMLVYFLSDKKSAKPAEQAKDNRTGVAEMLQKDVGFTDDQIAKYKTLKEKQKETIKPMFDDMRRAKDSLFRLLSYPETSDSLVSKAADIIAQRQKALDLQTFHHFKRVRTLCTPEQHAKYDSLVIKMFSKMGRTQRHGDTDKKEKQDK
jgi:Spy/CpxP family protein refolding chaperone